MLAPLILSLSLTAPALQDREFDADLTLRLNRFALALQRAGGSFERNVCISPLSITAGLYLLHAGARGETAALLERRILGADSARGLAIHAAFAARATELVRSPDDSQVALANSLWGQTGYPFSDECLEFLETTHAAPLRRIAFDQPGSEDTINAWVAQQTNDRIRDLLQPRRLAAEPRVELANAPYFKSAWLAQFDKRDTQPAPFHLSVDEQVSVPTMHATTNVARATLGEVELIGLPFVAGRTMWFALPAENTAASLEVLISGLDAEALLAGMLETAVRSEVRLTLPRFEFEFDAQLDEMLRKVGLGQLFSSAADFGRFDTGRGELQVGAALHKTFIAVDETGCEAAAATAMVMIGTSLRPSKPPLVRIDRPFWFAICDDLNGQLLFTGHVVDPRPSGT